MLKTGLSHGVAIIPNAPKQRFNDPETGAHFEFSDMCKRLEALAKRRFVEELQGGTKIGDKSIATKKILSKDFTQIKDLKAEEKPTTQGEKEHKSAGRKKDSTHRSQETFTDRHKSESKLESQRKKSEEP